MIKMQKDVLTNMLGCHLVDGAEHWMQQEQPEKGEHISGGSSEAAASVIRVCSTRHALFGTEKGTLRIKIAPIFRFLRERLKTYAGSTRFWKRTGMKLAKHEFLFSCFPLLPFTCFLPAKAPPPAPA